LFSDSRLSLAVARGSGTAVDTLGGLAQQAGIPASLHGTGGAWIIAGPDARPDALHAAVVRSLDRKVCNTLNTCCIPRERSAELVPAFLVALEDAGARLGQTYKLHVVEEDCSAVPAALLSRAVRVSRAQGEVDEMQVEPISADALGREWEWEQTPEVTLVLVDDMDEATTLFNRYSPRFVASLISDDPALHGHFFDSVDAPFVGDGFTRWVDGQYALKRPELGLSNWERGRLFGRGGVLSGDTVYTVRTRARHTENAKK
jgi:glutamate-5-semialdehyde dehydrogenase